MHTRGELNLLPAARRAWPFFSPSPASQEGQVPNSLWHQKQQPAGSRKQVCSTYDPQDPARLGLSLHLRSPAAGRVSTAGGTRHWARLTLKIAAASAIAAQAGLQTNMHITDFGVPSLCSISCPGDVHPKAKPPYPPKDGAVHGEWQKDCLKRVPWLLQQHSDLLHSPGLPCPLPRSRMRHPANSVESMG